MKSKITALTACVSAFNSLPGQAVSLRGIQEALSLPAGQTDIARVLLLIGIILLFAVLAGLWRYYRESGKKLRPLGLVSSAKQIRQIINGAVHQRKSFELQFPQHGVQRRPILRCTGGVLTSAGLVLRAEGLKNIARNWTDRLVNCYFKINAQGQYVYYSFSSRIKQVELEPHGGCALTLCLPKKLENRQKRAFLRLAPPREYLLGAALWMGRPQELEWYKLGRSLEVDTLGNWIIRRHLELFRNAQGADALYADAACAKSARSSQPIT